MSIRKGQDWGAELEPIAATVPKASSDAELAHLAQRGEPLVRLNGGDLWRTLGGPSRLDSGRLWGAAIDVGVCSFDGKMVHFVAHVVISSWMRRLPSVAVMNAEFLGDWDLAPRGHPNDGRLEVLEMEIPYGQRREFRRRVRSGGHLPHPGIKLQSVSSWQGATPGHLTIDGIHVGRSRSTSVSVIRDAIVVAI